MSVPYLILILILLLLLLRRLRVVFCTMACSPQYELVGLQRRRRGHTQPANPFILARRTTPLHAHVTATVALHENDDEGGRAG